MTTIRIGLYCLLLLTAVNADAADRLPAGVQNSLAVRNVSADTLSIQVTDLDSGKSVLS